jgi:hypothetical protein
MLEGSPSNSKSQSKHIAVTGDLKRNGLSLIGVGCLVVVVGSALDLFNCRVSESLSGSRRVEPR